MKSFIRFALLMTAAVPASALAQDLNQGEVVVTGSRIRPSYIDTRTNTTVEVGDDDASGIPAVGLRRRADYALLPVIIAGDTRERDQRRGEILTMVRSALERARGAGIELALGDPSAYLRRNLYITTSGVCSAPPLLCALLALGADHILFGTDYPFEDIAEAAAFLDNAPISESDRAKISHQNAERLLKL